MRCQVSEEQLWSWIDRNAPELDKHLSKCPQCKGLAEEIRSGMQTVAVGSALLMPPLPERVGPYVIKGSLGEGGQGLVYEAEQQMPKRPVAVKVIKGGRFVHEQEVKLFQREIQTLARLKHVGIAGIYEAGRTEDGQYYYAMELVRGVPLDVHVHDDGLPPRGRMELFGRICDAVQYAHQRGVIHRDLKPSNIFIDAEGNPKILDFGMAQIMDPDATRSTTGVGRGKIMGTLAYMSPEHARGHPHDIDIRSDVYSLGAILYELLTDRTPYCLCSTALPDAVRTICEEPPPKPSTIHRSLRGDMETIVLKALEKERNRRYQTVKELADDVRRSLACEPILARRPGAFYVVGKKLSKHRRGIIFAAAAVALAIIAVSGGVWWRDWKRARELHETREQVLRIQSELESGGPGDADVLHGEAHTVFEEHPELPEAILVYAQALFRAWREGENRALIDTATLELREQLAGPVPSKWAFCALLAEMYRITGGPEADDLQARADREAPDTAEAWYIRSFATLDKQQALRCAQKAVLRDTGHVLAWARLTGLCELTGELDEALRGADTLLRIGGDPARWTWVKGRILTRQDRFREAIEQLTALIANGERVSSAYVKRAHLHRCLGEYVQAVQGYTSALELYIGDMSRWVRYHQATALWILGRTEEAIEDYRLVRESLGYPSYSDARLFLIHRDRGELEEAAEVLNDAVAHVQDAWLARIIACLAGHVSPQALVAEAEQGGDREHLCEAYYYAGEVERLSNNLDRAEEYFKKCIGTEVMFDLDADFPTPMNEYDLARWRLRQLATDRSPASRAKGQ